MRALWPRRDRRYEISAPSRVKGAPARWTAQNPFLAAAVAVAFAPTLRSRRLLHHYGARARFSPTIGGPMACHRCCAAATWLAASFRMRAVSRRSMEAARAFIADSARGRLYRGFSCSPLPVCSLPETKRLSAPRLGPCSPKATRGRTNLPESAAVKPQKPRWHEPVPISHHARALVGRRRLFRPTFRLFWLQRRTCLIDRLQPLAFQTLAHSSEWLSSGHSCGSSTYPQERVFWSFP